jgi:hypothetical protein
MARLPLPEDYILATLKYTEDRLNSLPADLCSIYVKKPASNAACHSRHVIGL